VKTEFHPEAYEDMRGSALYYEERSPGLGKDFLAAVRETTRQIKRFPMAGPVLKGSIRKRLILGFPFAVLYQIEESKIYIAAVMHQHRRPGYWKHRVRD
jgi:plasmid stabilization system protein ParE